MDEPLKPSDAKALIVSILDTGRVEFSAHALKEMEEDGITIPEAFGVLRGGVVEPAELVRGSWRYRVRRTIAYVVVAFREEDAMVVVTAWRRQR